MVLDWLYVKTLAFGWLREMFDFTCNFRHVTSKKKCLLTPLDKIDFYWWAVLLRHSWWTVKTYISHPTSYTIMNFITELLLSQFIKFKKSHYKKAWFRALPISFSIWYWRNGAWLAVCQNPCFWLVKRNVWRHL